MTNERIIELLEFENENLKKEVSQLTTFIQSMSKNEELDDTIKEFKKMVSQYETLNTELKKYSAEYKNIVSEINQIKSNLLQEIQEAM